MQTNDAPGVTASAAVTERVTRYLAEHERSQAWLARQLPMSEPTLSRRLAGSQPWTLDELDDVARVLGVAPSELVAPIPAPRAAGDDVLADAGVTRPQTVVGVASVVVLALVVGWVAPYGVPVAALLAVGVWGILLVGMLRTAGPRPVVVAASVVAAVVAAGVGLVVPADAHTRPRRSPCPAPTWVTTTGPNGPRVVARRPHCVVRPRFTPTTHTVVPPRVTRGDVIVPTSDPTP